MTRKKELALRLSELSDQLLAFSDAVDRRLQKLESKVHPPSDYRPTFGTSKTIYMYSLPDQIIGLRNWLRSLESRVAGMEEETTP